MRETPFPEKVAIRFKAICYGRVEHSITTEDSCLTTDYAKSLAGYYFDDFVELPTTNIDMNWTTPSQAVVTGRRRSLRQVIGLEQMSRILMYPQVYAKYYIWIVLAVACLLFPKRQLVSIATRC
jgi:hypothetical protein